MDGEDQEMTTKEKIDKALGISCGKSIDQMLDELSLDTEQVTKTLDSFDTTLSASVAKIDEKAAELQRGVGNGILAIKDMTDSLKEIEGLVAEAKAIFLHIKENIISTDLIDSELIQGAAKFLEAMHVNIAEFISIYKQKSKFVEKVKLMILQQQQRIELAELKHRQNLELLEAKKKEPEAVDAEGQGIEFDTDSVVKSLSKAGAFDFVLAKQETVKFDDEAGLKIAGLEDEDDDSDDDNDEDEDEDGKPKKRKRG